jgi:hypoxanthine phosphoribosyltransferase
MKLVNCKIVSWSEIEEWTNDVSKKMANAGFKPDVVIGLTRGGWVPARLLCDILNIKDLYAVKTEHWGVTATRDGNAKLAQKLSGDVKGRRVLIMDDITDTGKSLSLAMDHVRTFKPRSLRSGTLLHVTHSLIEPNYYSVEVPAENWTWFIFPWNFNEDIRTLVKNAMEHGRTPSTIRKTLNEYCKITVSEDIIEEVLADIDSRESAKKQGKRSKKGSGKK